MTLKEKLHLAEQRLSLPALALELGLVLPDRPGSCRSPFREERKPSFSWWFADDGRARWKDHATGESGDSVAFLAKALGVSNREAVVRYLELAGVSDADSGRLPALKPILPKPILPAKAEPKEKPNLPEDLHLGTSDELSDLLVLRGWDVPVERLHEASSLGFLRFGSWQGVRAWFLLDPAGRFFEARRMDGGTWRSGAKSDSRGSKGLLGAELLGPGKLALLVEGAPDFLACSIYKAEGLVERMTFADDAVPVAMLGAGNKLKEDDLSRFKGVRVVIVPHLDSAGRSARDTWKAQLRKAGAIVSDFSLAKLVTPGGKDLADTFNPYPCTDVLWRFETRAEQLQGGESL
jgi:hypothetical protein